MRRKKGDPFSGRPHSGLGWVLLLAALALFLLAGAPGCMAQRMAWSARGTMIFLPSGCSGARSLANRARSVSNITPA